MCVVHKREPKQSTQGGDTETWAEKIARVKREINEIITLREETKKLLKETARWKPKEN